MTIYPFKIMSPVDIKRLIGVCEIGQHLVFVKPPEFFCGLSYFDITLDIFKPGPRFAGATIDATTYLPWNRALQQRQAWGRVMFIVSVAFFA